MLVNGQHHRTIEWQPKTQSVTILDQAQLPHVVEFLPLNSLDEAADAIANMHVRGAPLVGATAAYGMALAAKVSASDRQLERAAARLRATRPTAVNLEWAVNSVLSALFHLPESLRYDRALEVAQSIAEADVYHNERIG